MRRLLLLLLLVVSFALAGCRGQAPTQTKINCFVAASAKDAFAEIAKEYGNDHNLQIQVTGDDSSKLALQIENGAVVDIYLSAGQEWADHLRARKLTKSVTSLLTNRLVLIVPEANPGGVEKLADLLGPKVQRVAVAGPSVPAGKYARQALKKAEIWDALEKGKKIVSGENVRNTLVFVERGEAEAGVVYRTDADVAVPKVRMVHVFAKEDHEPIIYPLVLLKQAEDNAAALAFFEHLQKSDAARVFRDRGFGLVSPP